MRRRYLVTYDISADRRLKRVLKTMRGFGNHLQFSVFLCELNDVERLRMEAKLKSCINEKADQVLVVDLGRTNQETDKSEFRAIGRPLTLQPRARIA